MLHYLEGDATHPNTTGHKLIVHVCNDVGGWGRGFVLAISKRWSRPEHDYRAWYAGTSSAPVQPPPFALGQIQIVKVEPDISVVNMIAQHDTKTQNGIPPIRYEALRECLTRVASWSLALSASVHMPRIGCGLAGGEWSSVEGLIKETMPNDSVYVYDLPNNPIPWK